MSTRSRLLLGILASALGLPSALAAAGGDPRSGVPLGGLGAGKVEIFSDGTLGRATFNHNPDDPFDLSGSLFAVRVEDEGGTLVRALSTKPILGFEPAPRLEFRGLFPRATLDFEGLPVEVSLEAFSPLVPGDAEASGLPAATFALRVRNPGPAERRVSLLAAFENTLGCGGPWLRRMRDRTGNFVAADSRLGFVGARMVTERTSGDERRNHLGEYALLAAPPEGAAVTVRAYDALSGESLRADFEDGSLDGDLSLRGREGKAHPGAAVSATFPVPAGEERRVVFAFAWFLPHLVTMDGRDHPPAYARRFGSAAEAAAAALRGREEGLERTRAWQEALLESHLPGWLVRRLCDDAASLFSDTVWTADGTYATLDGAGEAGGALGSVDGRLLAHALSFAFFPDLDAAELGLFAAAQREDGAIPRSCGNLHRGFGGGPTSAALPASPETACAFVLQVEKHYRWTGDRAFLDGMAPRVRRALDWLAGRDADGDAIPEGGPDLDAAGGGETRASAASLYLAALRAGEWIARTLGDTALERACTARFEVARASFVSRLWNGRWFSESFDSRTGERSDACSVDQLAGEWFSTLLGWETLVPDRFVDAALATMLQWEDTQVASPGYARTYLASLAAARGRASEAMEILRGVDPAPGDSWTGRERRGRSQATPGAWFFLYALAGFAFDVPEGRLRLAPNLPSGRTRLRVPLFAPNFEARLDLRAPADSPDRTVRFEVRSVRRGAPIRLERFETAVPTLPDGATVEAVAFLDGRPVPATANVRLGGVALRFEPALALAAGSALEVRVLAGEGLVEVDAASGETRHGGGGISVRELEQGDGRLALRLRNGVVVDRAVRLRVAGLGGDRFVVRPGDAVVSAEELARGLRLVVPGSALPREELDAARAISTGARSLLGERARSIDGTGVASVAQGDLESVVQALAEAASGAEETGSLAVSIEAVDSAVEASALAAVPSGRGEDRRETLYREVLRALRRDLPRVRADLAGAAGEGRDEAMLRALSPIAVEVDPLETIEPGGRAESSLRLRNGLEGRLDFTCAFDPPEEFRVDPSEPWVVRDLLPGEEARLPFFAVAPEHASAGRRYALTLRGTVRIGDTRLGWARRVPLGRAYVTRWRAIGPFEDAGDSGLDTPFAPETGVDLDGRYPGKKGEVAWARVLVAGGRVDLEGTLGRHDNALAYAVCWVRSATDRDVTVEFGSDDGAKVWIGDVLAHEAHRHRVARPAEDRFSARLRAGWNRVLLKIEQRSGDWGFYFEFVGEDGAGVGGLEISDAPPPE